MTKNENNLALEELDVNAKCSWFPAMWDKAGKIATVTFLTFFYCLTAELNNSFSVLLESM